MDMREMEPMMRDCIEECSSCHDTCLETVAYCLEEGGKHTEGQHVRLLIDCAEICQTSANFMLRNSGMHPHTCAACAAVCERCAQDCERFTGEPAMQACAQACRSCAESCRRMAAMARAA
jgi:hypothetical protein